MRQQFFAVIVIAAGSGCTTPMLERYSLNQIASVSDLRYKEVMKNLAVLVANPAILPSFAVVADGAAQLIDTGTFDARSVWGYMFKGFISETLTGMASRNPQPQWTLDPVADEPLIKAQWCALIWSLYGPPPPDSEWAALLRQFQVDGELANLPPAWLHVGCCKDVPKNACYQAHCGGTYVWVTPDGMAGLSILTLVLLDIATVDLSSPLELPGPTASVVHEREYGDKGALSKVTTEYSLTGELQHDGTIRVGNFIFTVEDLRMPPPPRSGEHLLRPRTSREVRFLPPPSRGYRPAPRTSTSLYELHSIINAARGGR